jgi:hypothetical protein
MSSRRGRPPKAGERYASGRLRPDDPRIVALAQPHRRGEKFRLDQRAETPLGGLNIVGQLTDEQYEAGRQYAGVVGRYRVVIGAPRASPSSAGILVADGLGGGAPPLSIDEAERRKREYEAAYEALWDAGQRAAKAVARVAVYGEAWLPGMLSELRTGLSALAAHFRLTHARKSVNTEMSG